MEYSNSDGDMSGMFTSHVQIHLSIFGILYPVRSAN